MARAESLQIVGLPLHTRHSCRPGIGMFRAPLLARTIRAQRTVVLPPLRSLRSLWVGLLIDVKCHGVRKWMRRTAEYANHAGGQNGLATRTFGDFRNVPPCPGRILRLATQWLEVPTTDPSDRASISRPRSRWPGRSGCNPGGCPTARSRYPGRGLR